MSLNVTIHSMCYPPPRSELKAGLVRRVFGLPPLSESVPVIENCNFAVSPGEVIAIVGESGAGKTTLLRIIAGLETRYEGSVTFNGDRIEKPDRRIYLLPQDHTLLPWLTVESNMRFNLSEGEGTDMLEDLLETFGFLDMRRRYPNTLSGGERARVALMCTMCASPEVILFDEPFHGIDQITSEECQDDLLKWLKETSTEKSVILVSHNLTDAVCFADRIVVICPSPLRVHKVVCSSSVWERRSNECASLESEVFDALMEITNQQGDAAGAAKPRR